MNLSSNGNNNSNGNGAANDTTIGIGVVSYSSSNTPFLSSLQSTVSHSSATTSSPNNNNSNRRSSIINLQECQIPSHLHHHYHHIHHHHLHRHHHHYVQIARNRNLNPVVTNNNNNNTNLASSPIICSSSCCPSLYLCCSSRHNNLQTNAENNNMTVAAQPVESQSQPQQQAVTLTLITATPLTALTNGTPLIPILQQNQQPNGSPESPSTSLPNTSSLSSSTVPSTSAVSSSSSMVTSCTSCNHHAPTMHNTSRDWFSYEYKIENIQELIKSHENQQSFLQSPVFSFTNHIVNSVQSPSSQQTVFPATSSSSSTQPLPHQLNCTTPVNILGSSLTTMNVNDLMNSMNLSGNGQTMTQPVKQPSNWRLIFYPNGAGADCKNFLSIFLKYMSDEPVKIQMMFSIVDNCNEDVYVKYTVNKFNKSNDWGFKQLIHKNAILYQKEKFLKPYNGGTLIVRVKMRLDEHKHDYLKKLNDNLHYCKLLSENFSQYYYNNNNNNNNNYNNNALCGSTGDSPSSSADCTLSSSSSASSSPLCQSASGNSAICQNSSSSSSSPSSSSIATTLSQPSSSCLPSTSNNFTSKSVASNTHSSPLAGKVSSSSAQSNSSYYDILLLVKATSETTSDAASNVCLNCQDTYESKFGANSFKSISNSNKRSYVNDLETGPSKRARLSVNQTDVNARLCQKCSGTLNAIEFIEFRAHKCILAARSPVFKAMFNYKLKENLTNKVFIEDCRPEVVKALLKYIYTAYLPDDIRHIAVDLYIAAEKYFIESLKIKCREYLVENLNLESVIQTYILAEIYNDSMLRKQSLKFINENIEKVTQHSEWNEFMSVYPQYFTNALIRICKKDF